MPDRTNAAALDEQDALARYRSRFHLPSDTIYLDGNSLGAQPVGARRALEAVLAEWRDDLIAGWTERGWWELPRTLAWDLGPIVGAVPESLLICDTVTANLFKTLHAAVAMRPDRPTVLVEQTAFPTDAYIARSVADMTGRELRVVPSGEQIASHTDGSVAVALVNHVDFRTGRLVDMASITEAVHAADALALWDVSHSAGVVPMGLDEAGVDFAVGCTYKYLNGGPGAPAFLYAASRHIQHAEQPISGWLGHADPFGMTDGYVPDPGVRRFLTGTQQIVSMRALAAALEVFRGVDLEQIRTKSVALTELFIELIEGWCPDLDIVTPRQPSRRGSQVTLRHPKAADLYPEIVAAGVRGDFRPPDLLRFGFAPLYVSFTDVWDAADSIRQVVAA